jgi:HTH-type transcriptional regulator / antitoxin HigA
MTTFSLRQDWVSRVTKADDPDIQVIGPDDSPAPNAAELSAFLEELSRSEPVREMSRRKWLQPTRPQVKEPVGDRGVALFKFLAVSRATMPAYAMFKGRRLTAKRTLLDEVATRAWVARVTDVAHRRSDSATFRASSISVAFLRSLAQLSSRARGPLLALEAVREIGICVVLESGLPGMSVDGASFHTAEVGPVLALTVRHDRLDNFWFTLLHEIGHIYLHLREPSDDVFVDSEEESEGDEIEAEAEANAFAKDSLIPRDTWLRSEAHRLGNEASIVALAKQLHIHPAIVAGRIRFERREFRIFNDLIGRGHVREVVFAG